MSHYDSVGVDISKAKFDACILTQENYRHKIFTNNPHGFQSFLQWLNQYTQQPWIAMEATGHYSEPLAEFLVQNALRVSVVNPLQIKQFAKATLAHNKNDKADAHVIARYCRAMVPALYQSRSIEQKEIRDYVQLIDTLKGQKQQLKNQLESIHSQSVKKVFNKAIVCLEKQIQQLTDTLEHCIQAITKYQQWVQLLTSIKGIGSITAYQLIAYLPDLNLFQHDKQLAAFMGVSPKQKASGAWVGRTCLSKLGNARLRKVLYMPALSMKKSNEYLRPFVKRLEQNGLHPKAIVGALMRKLVHIIFGIMKSGRPFNPELV